MLQGISVRKLLEEYSLDRKTVRKYGRMLKTNEDVKYDNSFQRYCHFDKYKYEIINLFNCFKTETEIKMKLKENHKEKIL